MIYLLKASANSKRFGELIERDSSYSEVYFSLDKAVEEGKSWLKERLKFLNSQINNDLIYDKLQKNKGFEYSFSVTELDLDYIEKFNDLKDYDKDNYIEPTHKIYNYNMNGMLLNIDLEYRCSNGENLQLRYYERDKSKRLNKNITTSYTFENFIVNDNNEFAYNAALAVCDNYGNTYNPLFIYGDNGAGKTHLINAIKNKILLKKPKVKIVHLSSEDFIRQLVISIKNNNKDYYKKQFYDIDILIIEDIQFIIGKKKIEEEFLRILDFLYNKKIQIILSSDIEPTKLYFDSLSLKDRIWNGLLVPISKKE